jgi:hypothetical protein
MIDLNVIGKKYGPRSFEYTWKDTVLYALGIGAQAEELQFIYENVKGGLKVFPSFSVVTGSPLFKELFKEMKNVDFSRFIHGEQGIKLHRPIPPEGKTLVEGGITDIYDKGKGALFIWRMKVMTERGELLAEAEAGIFYVGEGGFGGAPKPKRLNLQRGPSRILRPPISFPETRQPSIASAATSTLCTWTPILPRWVVFLAPSSTAFAPTATP